MTDQSRVEAVEQAIGDYIWTHRTIDPLKLAKAAISANDAWLKERGWEPGQKGYSRYAMFAGIHRNPKDV